MGPGVRGGTGQTHHAHLSDVRARCRYGSVICTVLGSHGCSVGERAGKRGFEWSEFVPRGYCLPRARAQHAAKTANPQNKKIPPSEHAYRRERRQLLRTGHAQAPTGLVPVAEEDPGCHCRGSGQGNALSGRRRDQKCVRLLCERAFWLWSPTADEREGARLDKCKLIRDPASKVADHVRSRCPSHGGVAAMQKGETQGSPEDGIPTMHMPSAREASGSRLLLHLSIPSAMCNAQQAAEFLFQERVVSRDAVKELFVCTGGHGREAHF